MGAGTISLALGTVWNWVQRLGQPLVQEVEADVRALEGGDCRGLESLPNALKGQPMVLGALGLFGHPAPRRPHP